MNTVGRGILTLVFLVRLLQLNAQGNLVPNGNFEIYSSCPVSQSQLDLAVPWFNPNPASPEYYHMCAVASAPWVGVPDNAIGSQYPHSDSAYAGIVSFFVGAREYIEVELNDSMKTGETYCISYFISLAGKSDFATIPPQMHISDTVLQSTSWLNFTVIPQIIDTNIYSDTSAWLAVTGEYVAHGGELFITIGHFFDNANTEYDTIANNGNPISYFYVDDVSIYKKTNANAGPDVQVCLRDSIVIGGTLDSGLIYSWSPSVGLSDSTSGTPWAKPNVTTTYYLTISDTGGLFCAGSNTDSVTIIVTDCTPPPTFNIPTILKEDQLFFIAALPAGCTLEITDAQGRRIFREENYQNTFSVANLNAAVYVYELKLPDQTVQKGKFCVVK